MVSAGAHGLAYCGIDGQGTICIGHSECWSPTKLAVVPEVGDVQQGGGKVGKRNAVIGLPYGTISAEGGTYGSHPTELLLNPSSILS